MLGEKKKHISAFSTIVKHNGVGVMAQVFGFFCCILVSVWLLLKEQ